MEKEKLSFVERVKKFTPMHWVLLASLLLFASCLLVMVVIWTIDFAKGIPFITGPDDSGQVGEALVGYEVTIYLVFWVLFLVLVGLFVYELLFYPVDELVPDAIDRKEIVDGEVVDVHDTYEERYRNRKGDEGSSDQER